MTLKSPHRHTRNRTAAFTVAMLLLLAMIGVGPASAVTSTVGELAFTGAAQLPQFPCEPPPPFGNGPCNGTFSGDWSGHLNGVTTSGTAPYEVTWSTADGSGVTATFVYSEWQCAADTETVLGIAQGTGSASAGPGEVQGNWQVVGEAFPRDITAVTLNFDFAWTRTATSAVIVMDPTSMVVSVAGLGNRTVVTGEQIGEATFVPTDDSGSTPHVPSCDDPLEDVVGVIAGNVTLVQAT